MNETFVIVGAGQAGAQAAATLRAEGFGGRLVLLGEEGRPPYERPPLSKALLAGTLAEEKIYLRKPSFYTDKSIELRPGTAVQGIDRAARLLRLADGTELGYDRLLLATGAEVRRLPVPGAGLGGVHYLRTAEDCLALRAELTAGRRVAVVGGGYIGLEVAAAAVKAGARPVVLEAAARVMARVTCEPVSRFYEELHRRHGVELRLGTQVAALEGEGRVARVRLADGTAVEADLVVVGVGIRPCDDLARAAGLACEDGILVDAVGRTSDPAIFAAGDVARQPNPVGPGLVRLECVQNAIGQAQAAARAMLGVEKPNAEVPWFWSDQFGVKLQIAGLARPDDTVLLRGDPAQGRFAALYLRDGRLAAIDTVDALKDFLPAKKLIAEGRRIDPARAADPAVPLAEAAVAAEEG
ncbi:MAG TPA: FAD-dependent oxidoreductase [Azospirillaceae bacterium]|nr:FAD-dependent oxidoreductase [Azospirillaceae bacterium]